MQENSISSLANFWKHIDLAIMGIGIPDERSRIYGMISPEMRNILKDSQACCEVAFNFFDEDGLYKPIFVENKISIPYEDLKAIKTKTIIGHGLHKARAIISGLRAGMINILITDSITISEIEAILAVNLE